MSQEPRSGAGGVQSLPGEEDLRFIRNFHDIFLSIGLLMFAAGLATATSILLEPLLEEAESAAGLRHALLLVVAASAFDALVMWLLAEFFARGRRLFLPSIVILLAFAFFVSIAAGAAYCLYLDIDPANFTLFEGMDSPAIIRQLAEFYGVIAGVTTIAIFAFYARMKLPFAMGLGAASLTGTATALAVWIYPAMAETLLEPAQLYSGLFLFLLGIVFDARDPKRLTRISDNGFWLHFFAAPMILNATISMLVNVENIEDPQTRTSAALVTLAVVLGFAFVSLLINRRALLVAGLLYALISAGYLISRAGLSGAWTVALTLLILGAAMVLLGGGWHTLRRIVVAPFPKEGLLARIIPPEPPRADRDPSE